MTKLQQILRRLRPDYSDRVKFEEIPGLPEVLEELQAYIVEDIIGEDDALRNKSDMLEPTYHRNKGRNQLREDQRAKLRI